MSQSNSGNYMDYMDGVPVKISDKCKPPPEISLPYGVVESSSRAYELIHNTHYDFSLENNVLKKLEEWQNAREMVKNARNHRLQFLEEARQRELELKATTESEEKLKQLSISEVSYPSTDEISEISPDDYDENKVINERNVNYVYPNEVLAEKPPDNTLYVNVSNPDVVCDILQPVPISPTPSPWSASTNLLDDPHPLPLPLPKLKQNQYIRNNYMKNNLDHLTYLDFENDTSSPFDNMELKTINDKELLAQVLNPNQANTLPAENSRQPQYNNYSMVGSQQYSTSHSTSNSIDNNSVCKSLYNNSFQGETTSVSNAIHTFPFVVGGVLQNNGYYRDASGGGNTNVNNVNPAAAYYAPDYNNYVTGYQPLPNAALSDKPFLYSDKLDEHVYNVGAIQYQRDVSDISQSYINAYGYCNTNYPAYYTSTGLPNSTYLPLNSDLEPATQEAVVKLEQSQSKSLMGTRSRSVPDIVKELDEEVAMARMRAKERSHNCSPSIRPSPEAVSTALKIVEELVNPYNDLTPELQGICKRVSVMGFPLDRVARVCQDLGAEDKKIIEFLLLMGQLMDLGFPESSVSKALLKHNCNRDKALDELIS